MGEGGVTAIPARGALAALAAAGGLLAALAGSPYLARHAVVDVERLAAAVAHEDDHVTAIELAQWIRDRKPGLRIIDLRTAAEFDGYHLPHAERVAIDALSSTPFQQTDTLVLISGGGTHAGQAWVLLQALGYRHVYFLRGGLQEWLDDVMNPTIASGATAEALAAFHRVADLSRYFGGVPRILDQPGGQASSSWSPGSREADGAQPSSETAAAVTALRRRGC